MTLIRRDRVILATIFISASMFSLKTFSFKIFYHNAKNALLEEYMLPLNLCH